MLNEKSQKAYDKIKIASDLDEIMGAVQKILESNQHLAETLAPHADTGYKTSSAAARKAIQANNITLDELGA